jgi:hypothetical protein
MVIITGRIVGRTGIIRVSSTIRATIEVRIQVITEVIAEEVDTIHTIEIHRSIIEYE